MRISDWSSDVCSSDLADQGACAVAGALRIEEENGADRLVPAVVQGIAEGALEAGVRRSDLGQPRQPRLLGSDAAFRDLPLPRRQRLGHQGRHPLDGIRPPLPSSDALPVGQAYVITSKLRVS